MDLDLTDQERQLIECLRDQAAGPRGDDFGISIRLEDGAWEIKMSSGKLQGRGVGANFDAAWDNITGLQFDRSTRK